MELADKTAIITEASSEIGEATARELDAAGMRLVLTARSKSKLKSLAATLSQATYVAGEIADPELPAALLNTALKTFQRADVLFNNAGVMTVGTVETVDIEALCQIIRINVEVAFRMAYVFSRHFKQVGSGYLINLSSVAGMTNDPTMAAYWGSKHALAAFTDCLRLELAGSGVGVACIEAGMATNCQRWSEADKSMDEQPLMAEDIAQMVLFILMQRSNVNVGRILVVPGNQLI